MHRVELKAVVVFFAVSGRPFLMHRVELKAGLGGSPSHRGAVPNAPCGVESREKEHDENRSQTFLMHRVELKELLPHLLRHIQTPCS